MLLHELELAAADDPVRLGCQRQREHHQVGTRERIRVPVGLEHVVDPFHVAHVLAHDGDVAVERLQQTDERLGDPAAAEDADPRTEQVASDRRGPFVAARVLPDATQSADPQPERELGDGLGVHTLAARPHMFVVDQVDEVLDPGERQLHPLGVARHRQRGLERGRVEGVGPDHAVRFGERDEVSTTFGNRIREPAGCRVGSERDAWRVGTGHGPLRLARTVSGRW